MTARPFSFAFTFLALFALAFAFMWSVNALPNMQTGFLPVSNAAPQDVQSAPAAQPGAPAPSGALEYPTRVVAKSIGLDVKVVNPATTSVAVLDSALEDGSVRYPTSALLGAEGTVLLFGHSSYLPIVYHQYYKTFNGIQNLKEGDTVSVYAGDTEYRYRVASVALANAEQDVIELPQSGKHLVLVTCDSFATKSTRYIVRADYVGS